MVTQLWMEAVEGQPGVRKPLDGTAWHVPPRLGLDMPGVTLQLKPGQRVLLDDGKLEAVVEVVDASHATARVVRTFKERVKLRAEKGVNFPESALRACVLSRKDLEVLPGVLEFADVLARERTWWTPAGRWMRFCGRWSNTSSRSGTSSAP
ncbi:pyruvate kinase [Pyxidicoccus trucidator]|uniref:pyruvate kinase n=1 Tax=Pyxidicoccus trucidator TaxID=2709662 RepID=UPI0013D939F8|nr:pyruvate kinase [Pyxidicoccus trucidator]